jgi:amidase
MADYRVFILDEYPVVALDTQTRNALHDVEAALRKAGAHVARSSDRLPDLAALAQTARQIGRARRAPDPPTVAEWFKALDEQHSIRRRWAYFFEDFDVVLSPAFGTAAFPHTEEPDWSKRTLLIDGRETSFGDQQRWMGIASLAHLPAAVAPIGVDRDGMPIGVQVIAPFLGDLTAVHFAGLIARTIPEPALRA